MNLNLFKQALKERWVGGLIFALSLVLYGFLIISLAKDFIGNPAFEQLLEAYPKEFLPLLAGAGDVNFFTIEGFLTVEFLALWWIVILSGFAISFATGVVSKEIDEGTIEFLLAEPLRRSTLIITRFTALFVYLALLIAVSLGSILVLGPLYDVELKAGGLFAVGLLALAHLLTISAYALFFSVVVRGRSRAVVMSVAVLIGSHLLNALGQLNETIDDFRVLSHFHYYEPYNALRTGSIPWSDIALFAGATAVLVSASILIFRSRDITVT